MTRILIVEDDRATGALLKTIFEMEGFRTWLCAHVDRVMETARLQQPDVILMDFHLAGLESLSVLREIKQDGSLRSIPVIMTSGLDRSEDCIRAGADGFLIKPFRPADLLHEVRAVLDGNPA